MNVDSYAVRGIFNQVRKVTEEVAAAMPPEQGEYKAVPVLMSFRQMLLHILSSYETLMNGFPNGPFVWETKYNDQNFPTMAALLEELPKASAKVDSWLAGLTEEDLATTVEQFGGASLLHLILEWIMHEVHHRGQLYIYLRENGITPPSMY
jgi:uncharacterized damage-inducible protein DinB